MRFFVLVILHTLLAPYLGAQVSFDVSRGFVIPHRPVMQGVNQAHATQVALNYEGSYSKKASWANVYRNPTWSLGLSYTKFGSDIFGSAISGDYKIQLPLNTKRSLLLILGGGLSMHSQKFDIEKNYKNTAIGSRINLSISSALHMALLIKPRYSISAVVGLHHFSNGAFSAPNLGLNVPLLGLRANFSNTKAQLKAVEEPSLTDTAKPTSVPPSAVGSRLVFSLGMKEILLKENKKYLIPTLRYEYGLSLGQKFSLLTLADFMHHAANGVLINLDTQAEPQSAFQIGIGFGLQSNFGKSALYLHNGIYLFNSFKDNGRIYNRIGFSRQINQIISVHIGIKSHLSTADFVECGLFWSL